MSYLRALTIVVTVAICLGLAINSMADDAVKFGKVTDEEFAMGAPAKYPEANAMVLIDYGEMEIKTSNLHLERTVRIKILTEAGIEEVGEQSIPYNSKYDKIKNFKAQTITPDGKKYDLEKNSKFTKESGVMRYLEFTFPKLEPGAIIEYKYTLISDRFYNLTPWLFQTDIYTVKSIYKVTPAAGFNYNVQCHNCPTLSQDPKIEERPDVDHTGLNIRTFVWTAEDMPPITDEPYMAAAVNYIASLQFQLLTYKDQYNFIKFVESWDKLGADAESNFDGYNNKSKDIEKLATEIVGDLTDNMKKSRAIYEYVMQNYVRIYDYNYWYFGSAKIEDLLRDKQGTPESLNFLICLLHRAAGIESWPIFISSRSHGFINIDNPSLQQFDHLISYVQFPNSYVLLDAHYKNTPYGILPPNSLVDIGFLIKEKDSKLIKIEMLPATSDRIDLTTIRIDSTGNAECQSQCRMTGYWASTYARRAENRTDEEVVEDYLMGRLDCDYDLSDHRILLDTNDQFVADVDFTSTDLIETLDNNFILKPVNYAYRTNPFKREKRFFPVDFQYPFKYISTTNFISPSSIAEVQVPTDTTVAIAGAVFERSSAKNDSTVSVTMTLTIDQPIYEPRDYWRLRDLFAYIAESCGEEIIVSTSGE